MYGINDHTIKNQVCFSPSLPKKKNPLDGCRWSQMRYYSNSAPILFAMPSVLLSNHRIEQQ